MQHSPQSPGSITPWTSSIKLTGLSTPIHKNFLLAHVKIKWLATYCSKIFLKRFTNFNSIKQDTFVATSQWIYRGKCHVNEVWFPILYVIYYNGFLSSTFRYIDFEKICPFYSKVVGHNFLPVSTPHFFILNFSDHQNPKY